MPFKSSESVLAYRKIYYERNREGQKAYSKNYYHAHKTPERKAAASARAKEWRKDNYRTNLITAARGRARRRGIEFTITAKDIYWPTRCPVFLFALDYSSGTKNGKPRPNSPSLDRIDPGKGYVIGNVQIISFRANGIKNNATPEELRAVADYMAVFG